MIDVPCFESNGTGPCPNRIPLPDHVARLVFDGDLKFRCSACAMRRHPKAGPIPTEAFQQNTTVIRGRKTTFHLTTKTKEKDSAKEG